jgi:hypothetical protein
MAVAAARDEERAPRHVELRLITEEPGVVPLESVLTELLARLQVSVTMKRVPALEPRQILSEHPADPEAVARVWIDLRSPERVTVYLAGNREDRALVRQVPRRGEFDEVSREEVAQIVEASVEALLVGGRIGVSSDEPRRPEPPPPPPPSHILRLAVSYEGQAWSSSLGPLHGPGVTVEWLPPAGLVRPLIVGEGFIRYPFTVAGDPISTRLDQQSLRLLIGASWAVSRRWRLQGALGGGLDFVRSTPVAPPSTHGVPDPASNSLMPMGRAFVAVRFALTSRADVFCTLGADLAAYNVRYWVDRPDTTEVLFQPWRLRPFASLGVSADVLPQ